MAQQASKPRKSGWDKVQALPVYSYVPIVRRILQLYNHTGRSYGSQTPVNLRGLIIGFRVRLLD